MKNFFVILFLFATLVYSQNLDNKYRLAQTYEMAGQFEKAEEIYRELFQLQPFNYSYFESLSRNLITQKKYDSAIQLIQNRIAQNPNDVTNYGMLGSVYFMTDNIQQAYEIWEKGIATNPKSNVVYRVIANYALENRAFEKAIDYLKRGKVLADDKYVFSLDLANIYAINMNFESAATEFCELIVSNPEFISTVKPRISSYITRPQAAEQTINAIKNFIKSNSKLELYDLLSSVYQQIGDYQNAFDIIVKMENQFNGNGSHLYFFALEAFRSKQFDISAKSFKMILEKYPNSNYEIAARIGFAKTLEESLNKKSELIDQQWKPFILPQKTNESEYKNLILSYQKFIDEFKENSNSAEAYFRIAEIYSKRLFDFQKADSVYHLVELHFPYTNYSILSLINRGRIFIQENKLTEAQALLTKVLQNQRSEPTNIAEANFLLAKIEFWSGNFSNSISRFQENIKNLQDDFANDALENLFLINSTKKDSLNLLSYAKAELLLLQNNLQQAFTEFKTLSENDNLFLINQFAKLKIAEILIAQNKFFEAEEILKKLSESEENGVFSEKSLFLLAQTQKYGEKNIEAAKKTYALILEKFPNSIYFDRVREELNAISN